jgi:hypothetical protein
MARKPPVLAPLTLAVRGPAGSWARGAQATEVEGRGREGVGACRDASSRWVSCSPGLAVLWRKQQRGVGRRALLQVQSMDNTWRRPEGRYLFHSASGLQSRWLRLLIGFTFLGCLLPWRLLTVSFATLTCIPGCCGMALEVSKGARRAAAAIGWGLHPGMGLAGKSRQLGGPVLPCCRDWHLRPGTR